MSLRSRTTAVFRALRFRLCPAPRNRTRGGGRRHSASGAARAEEKDRDHDPEIHTDQRAARHDEDRDGPIGFDSKAERARLFAAEMALQSFALLAAAEGAIAAYADVTGETWKPYEAPLPPAGAVSRQSAAAEMAAFQAA